MNAKPLDQSLPNNTECCGCSACFAICPVNAITMRPDSEGFLQPAIDDSRCIRCGKCKKACPVLNQGAPRIPLSVYAAKAKDDDLRRISSSGGMFSLLARDVIKHRGIVYGAAFEAHTHRVVHQAAENENDLDKLRGSKYVQSDIGDIFTNVKHSLDSGREVLFSGCPCQVAGLRNFLGMEHLKLLTIEVICHAVPSPMAWQKYLSCLEHANQSRIIHVSSRRDCDWREYTLSFEIADSSGDTHVLAPAHCSYLQAFGSELFNRKCCHRCRFRAFKSGADITMGDFWGVEQEHPEINDDKGVSAVICNTPKGKAAFSAVYGLIKHVPSTVRTVARHNKTLFGNHRPNKLRKCFFAEITDSNFDELVERLMTPPLWYRALRWIKWHTMGKPNNT